MAQSLLQLGGLTWSWCVSCVHPLKSETSSLAGTGSSSDHPESQTRTAVLADTRFHRSTWSITALQAPSSGPASPWSPLSAPSRAVMGADHTLPSRTLPKLQSWFGSCPTQTTASHGDARCKWRSRVKTHPGVTRRVPGIPVLRLFSALALGQVSLGHSVSRPSELGAKGFCLRCTWHRPQV